MWIFSILYLHPLHCDILYFFVSRLDSSGSFCFDPIEDVTRNKIILLPIFSVSFFFPPWPKEDGEKVSDQYIYPDLILCICPATIFRVKGEE